LLSLSGAQSALTQTILRSEWARAFNALKEWDNKLSLECGIDSVDKMR
jgi:hypothetical protein